MNPPYIPETESTKNQILYTFERSNHNEFLENLKGNYLTESSIMVSMSKSIQANSYILNILMFL